MPVARVEEPGHGGVDVKGLEGSLSAYDVREAMNGRLDALGACQQERIRRVRALSGHIQLAVHVLTDGSVGQVDVVQSDLGDRPTEQCIAEVTRNTPFPKPHGGEADVKWDLTLDPHGRRAPEPYEEERLRDPLELRLPDVAEACEMKRRDPHVTVTAYVASSGKVVAAGASSAAGGHDALLACAAEQVTTWRLPRPQRLQKAQFELRYLPPLTDAKRQAIRKRQAQRRKAEARREQAEAKRKRAEAKRNRAKAARARKRRAAQRRAKQ